MVVGMGKKEQAENIHRFGIEGSRNILYPSPENSRYGNIIAGVGIVENYYDKIAHIKAHPMSLSRRKSC